MKNTKGEARMARNKEFNLKFFRVLSWINHVVADSQQALISSNFKPIVYFFFLTGNIPNNYF